MKFRVVFIAVLGGLIAGAVWAAGHQTFLLEKILNTAAPEYFQKSIRLTDAGFDRKLRLRIREGKADLQTSEGPYPVEIRSLQSTNSAASFLLRRPIFFSFTGVKRGGSSLLGIRGSGEVRFDGFLRIEAEIQGLGLEDIAVLNPQNLKGASGGMQGKITFETRPGREPVFEADLHSQKPGGKIPAQFFEAFLPYLPQIQNRKELEAIIRAGGVAAYDEADLKAASAGGGRIKLFLHMRLPDYNFNLNLNVEIRVDEENFFQALSKWIKNNEK